MDRGRVGEDRGSEETDGCPLTGEQGLFKENKPIPIDVREKRTNMEIKDVTMKDVTNGEHKKFQTTDMEPTNSRECATLLDSLKLFWD
jgi:hypothetical protein